MHCRSSSSIHLGARLSLNLLGLAASALFLFSSTSRAETYAANANHCAVKFYDPDMHSWLAYRNTCNAAIYIVYVSGDGHHTGSMHLGIGKHDGTGHDLNEVEAWRDFQTYACPEGYTPVGPDSQFVTRPNVVFRCRSTN
jgi:hypothetical protein